MQTNKCQGNVKASLIAIYCLSKGKPRLRALRFDLVLSIRLRCVPDVLPQILNPPGWYASVTLFIFYLLATYKYYKQQKLQRLQIKLYTHLRHFQINMQPHFDSEIH